MRALVKAKKAEGLWAEDVARPELGHNDVLIRITKTAICGTDIHIYEWNEWAQHTIPVPMTVGHEFAGEIVELGSEVKGLEVGQRVSGEGHVTCGHCRNCRAGRRHLCPNTRGIGVNRPGAFAEYLSLPAVNVYPLPDSVPDEIAAFLDPLGNATHTALSFDLVGEDVLITGAGPIGCMAAAIARHVGARRVVVTDLNDYRLDLARKMGADRTVNVKTQDLKQVARELCLTEGFDVGLEMSGNAQALNQMISVMVNGGRIALLGLPPGDISLDLNQVIFKGLFLKGIYGREMFETWYKMIAMLDSGLDIRPLLTHQLPVADFQKGFDVMLSGQSGKVVLDWT
ncbi:MAG: L-threonine 3-dehydrogenase [Gammaproteobacteria bacterium]|nr:L-threonine 3-dehydrogenase [Gammaproteobacteria bacterium]